MALLRNVFCVVRKCKDDGHEWLDVKNSMGGTPGDAQVEANKLDRVLPGWAKDNPVVRVAKVQVTEVEETATGHCSLCDGRKGEACACYCPICVA